MATANQTPKSPKTPKPAVAMVQKLSDQLKKAVLSNKLTSAELDTIATLAGSLKAFVSTQ